MSEHEEGNWISAWIDGELSGDEKAKFEAHLSECALCREELDALREIKRRLGAAPRRAMPPNLLAEIDSGARGRSMSRTWIWAGAMRFSQTRRWAPAAAFAAILGLGIWMGFFRHSGETELPIDVLAAAHSRYSAEGLIPGDIVASNFSKELATYENDN